MLKRTIISLALILSASVAQAALISHTDITPSTDLTQSNQGPTYNFSIDQIADGIVELGSPYNGFASIPTQKSGIITLQLSKAFDLWSFVLWNDIYVIAEGITSFELSFFDSLNNFISTTEIFTIPNQGIPDAQTFHFASTVTGVSKVELNVLTANGSRETGIEIGEVSFNGQESRSTVSDSGSSLAILGLGLASLVGFRRLKR